MAETNKEEEKKGEGQNNTNQQTAVTAQETPKTGEEVRYVNGVDVEKLKSELSKVKTDTGYDVSLDEETGKITVTIPSDSKYDADKIKYVLKPYIEKNGNAPITINKQKSVNLDKLRTNFNDNGTKKSIKLATMKEKLLHKIPDFDDFQRIHTKALIERLEDIDEDNDVFHNLATSLKLHANDKEDILQYMRNNIDTEEVRMALAELNYNNKNIFNSEKQQLANELQARGITRKELGKLSDEEITDTRSLNKIQRTLNQSEQQIKQEMKEIRKKVRNGWFGWIRDFLGLYGTKYKQQEKLLQQMKEQKNKVQNNIVASAAHANKIFENKTKSRQASSGYIEQHQDGIVNSQKTNISTSIDLLGIGNTDTSYAPSSGTEGIENSGSAPTMQI